MFSTKQLNARLCSGRHPTTRPTGPEQTRGTRPGQDPKRVATSLVLDTFREFLSNETDVWLVKRETLESQVRCAGTVDLRSLSVTSGCCRERLDLFVLLLHCVCSSPVISSWRSSTSRTIRLKVRSTFYGGRMPSLVPPTAACSGARGRQRL